MKLLFDLHTHTIASGHAYSTLRENIEIAKKRGLLGYGFSDHAEMMPGSFKNIYFENFKVIPKEIEGIKIFAGVEANILDFDGTIDVNDSLAVKVDYIIASLHSPCFKSGTPTENTNALIKAMKNKNVKIIGHPDDGRYIVDYDTLIKAAIEYGTVIELNNSSLLPQSTRKDGILHARECLVKCKQYGAKIIVNSDSHICYDVGRFTEAEALLKELEFPEELVLNTNLENIKLVLNK
ncbi:MAG: phosphatase [Sedimentibacter sp.]|uniref:phosphatase n=1 Tax=Sedimentibacter sp. TaxID=1960295 RepID=UPI002980A4D3|nr:phosphatase [Sedimentibacter sp.]MDW5299953.1 phosphatase [Sedimentibacter sp.]